LLEVGAKLPSVSVADDSGEVISTDSLVGRRIILYFYPKDDTPGCTVEAGDFATRHEAFSKKGVDVVGVSRDSVASHQKFKENYGLPFRLLADVDEKLCGAFGVLVEKNNYGKKSIGIQRSTFLFDEQGKLVKVWPKVSVDGHADEILGALN
jgi:peroxiredoxin Q/BCP